MNQGTGRCLIIDQKEPEGLYLGMSCPGATVVGSTGPIFGKASYSGGDGLGVRSHWNPHTQSPPGHVTDLKKKIV